MSAPKTKYITQLDKYIEFVKDFNDSERLIEVFKDFRQKQNDERLADAHSVPFGKYRGKPLTVVMAFDKNYLNWLVKQDSIKNYKGFYANLVNALDDKPKKKGKQPVVDDENEYFGVGSDDDC